MYLFLHDNLSECDFSSNVKAIGAIDTIFSSAFDGCHIVGGDIGTLRALKEVPGFSRRTYDVLKKAINWFPQHSNFLNTFSHGVIIENGLKDVTRSDIFFNWWRIPLEICGDIKVLGQSLLLAENMIDCDMYVHAAEHYRMERRLNSLCVQPIPRGGGGSAIKVEFAAIASSKKNFCICVTDSDVFSPRENIESNNSNLCERIVKSTSWPVFHVSTEGRELENEIPHSFISQYVVTEKEVKDRWSKILSISANSKDTNVLKYADLKEGVSVWWIVNRNKGSYDFNYWKNALLEMPLLEDQPKLCLQENKCALNIEDKDKLCPGCTVLPGISRKIADNINQWLKKFNVREAFQIIENGDPNKDCWLSIGKTVFEYCCASDKMRV